MAPGPRRRQGGDSRVGTMLAIVGCLGALGATFGVGLYSGWYWALSSRGVGTVAQTEKATAKGTRPSSPTPALTFYQELTAPLGASPTVDPKRLGSWGGAGAAPAPDPSTAARTKGGDRSTPYTVQVGAYRDRASAESLRAVMAAAGHDAYLIEVDGPSGGARYRVRVGSFTSREAATAAVARLERDGQRSAYVTSR